MEWLQRNISILVIVRMSTLSVNMQKHVPTCEPRWFAEPLVLTILLESVKFPLNMLNSIVSVGIMHEKPFSCIGE